MFARHPLFATLYLLTAFFVPIPAQAVEPLRSADYAAISPVQKGSSAEKIEVVEFFSYSCPHCMEINPSAHAWAARQPKDIVFKRVPVAFNRTLLSLTRLFYTLEATGDLQRLDQEVFDALHKQRIRLTDESVALEWVEMKGVNKQKFIDAYRSPIVERKIREAQVMTEAYGVDVVPNFAVDGRYRILNSARITSLDELLVLTDLLIQKVRAERVPGQ